MNKRLDGASSIEEANRSFIRQSVHWVPRFRDTIRGGGEGGGIMIRLNKKCYDKKDKLS